MKKRHLDHHRSSRPGARTLHVALALLLVAAVTLVGRSAPATAASAVSLTSDPAAPGMLRVAWTAPADGIPVDYRVQWWAGSGATGAPIGSVSLTAGFDTDSTTRAVAIPGLTPSGVYTARVDTVLYDPVADAYVADRVVGEATAAVPATAVPPCPFAWRLCAAVEKPVGATPAVMVHTADTSSSGFTGTAGGVFGFGWSPPQGWPVDNAATTGGWTRVRVNVVDRQALMATTWWAAFGDLGASWDTATEVLVPLDPDAPSVYIGSIAAVTGSAVSGTLSKQVDGGTAPLVASDFLDLCVQVQRVTADAPETVTELCGARQQGFGSPASPGDWKLALRPGSYRLRFVDRINHYGIGDTPPAPVTFAPQWWRSDGERGENQAGATLLQVQPSTPISGIDAVLRPAKQLRVDITDPPATWGPRAQGSITVTDDFGNWTEGTMTFDPARRLFSAVVNGLVDARSYRVIVRVHDPDTGDHRWWLIGGGTLEDAAGVVPGAVRIEPFANRPIAATLHRPDGTPYGAGEACIALRRLGSPSASPDASTCAAADGTAVLQRVPNGTYRAVAYRRDPASGATVGTPVRLADVTVTRDMPTAFPSTDLAHGISDVTRLQPGAQIPSPYSAAAAVVIP